MLQRADITPVHHVGAGVEMIVAQSGEAGKQNAAIYSIVGTCRILGIDVREYLLDVFTRLPGMTRTEAEALTPSNWLKARRQKTPAVA